jgi:DNA polymerase
VLVACDSAQIEARVVAWLAGEANLLDDFRAGKDIYSKFASSVYNKPVTKDDKIERFVGKTCIVGLGYGMGAEKFQNTLKIGMGGVSADISIEDAKRVVTLYRNTYHRISQLWNECTKALDKMARGNEYFLDVGLQLRCDSSGVLLPNGTMIRYPNLRKTIDGYEYDGRYGPVKLYGGKLVENIVQALARIVVFDQMAKVDQQMRQRDHTDGRYRTVLTVHDEVVCIVPEAQEQWCKDLMVHEMSTPPRWCADLPVSCECESGNNYADAK